MKTLPILFNAEMVRAVLDGRKTVTRRPVKWPVMSRSDGSKSRIFLPNDAATINVFLSHKGKHPNHRIKSPFGVPGDRLWVRETWAIGGPCVPTGTALPLYRAGASKPNYIHYSDPKVSDQVDRAWRKFDGDGPGSGWTPSIHMPRWASRITLEVVSVRVERLHEIDEPGAQAEGVTDVDYTIGKTYVTAFNSLWWDIYPDAEDAYNWEANPWVWVVEFKRVEG